jgi:tetratricopeptide (TPR) repeat protein
MLNRPLIAALAAAAALLLQSASAADDPTPPRGAAAANADKLAPARALIAEGKWTAAIDALKAVNDGGSADWNNLMGYSHRKARTPDYAAAERYYDAALRIDPRHKGALEYSGELYLMMGNAAKAEARLAALNGVCGPSCAEYKDLKAAIERQKAAPK